MEINVLFYGVLAGITGIHRKHYRGINSYQDLRFRIRDDFPGIDYYNFRIAVNNQIVNEDPVLMDNDEVAFIPPFEGG